jgi:long-chain acyl-CoA synthetase
MSAEPSAEDGDGAGFWAQSRQHPDKAAVVMASGPTLTYGELASRANRLSHLLRARGVGEGDHVAFLLGNQIEMFEAALACTQIGILFTPVNRNLATREVGYILEDAGVRVFLTDSPFADVARAAADAAGLPAGARLAFGEVEGFERLRPLAATFPDELPAEQIAGRPFFYTSGTTGHPKAVIRPGAGSRTLGTALSESLSVTPGTNLTADGVHLVQGPLHHSGPLGNAMSALHVGRTVVVMEKWDAERCLSLIERHRVTSTLMVPTMFRRLLALPAEVRARYDVSSLRAGTIKHGSSACPVQVKRAMIDWLGPILFETYGGQEGRVTVVSSPEWLQRPGTVGKVDRLTTVKIFDEKGRECGPGEVGTIYAALGEVEYFNAPKKSDASRRGDLFTLGDMGYYDAEGWLFLVDRRVDLIVSGGVNIYPAEIEAILLQHPAVRDAAVIGIPNEEWGHEVKAIVEPTSMTLADAGLESELIELVRGELARYKAPRSVEFRPELPRDAMGKLRRHDLRDEYLPASP